MATAKLNLMFCTLTGVDDKTSLIQIAELSERFPFVEWGFLYSPKRQGNPGRYPSVKRLHEAFETLPAHVNVALHICGEGVANLIRQEESSSHETNRLLSEVDTLVEMVSRRAGRVQLNFNQTKKPQNLEDLKAFIKSFPALQVITQHNQANKEVLRELAEFKNHSVLSDSSGGMGVLSSYYPSSATFRPVKIGYAGGLSADNLSQQLPLIAEAAAGEPTWIDMEGSLRLTDAKGVDWFDMERCEKVLEVVSKYLKETAGTANVTLQLTLEQAVALNAAADFYSRVLMGQLEEVELLVREGIIPKVERVGFSTSKVMPSMDECDEIRELMKSAKAKLGVESINLGLGNPVVHINGHRAYEIHKVLAKVIAERRNPHPVLKTVDYDGLGPRYTSDPAPVAG